MILNRRSHFPYIRDHLLSESLEDISKNVCRENAAVKETLTTLLYDEEICITGGDLQLSNPSVTCVGDWSPVHHKKDPTSVLSSLAFRGQSIS